MLIPKAVAMSGLDVARGSGKATFSSVACGWQCIVCQVKDITWNDAADASHRVSGFLDRSGTAWLSQHHGHLQWSDD